MVKFRLIEVVSVLLGFLNSASDVDLEKKLDNIPSTAPTGCCARGIYEEQPLNSWEC